MPATGTIDWDESHSVDPSTEVRRGVDISVTLAESEVEALAGTSHD